MGKGLLGYFEPGLECAAKDMLVLHRFLLHWACHIRAACKGTAVSRSVKIESAQIACASAAKESHRVSSQFLTVKQIGQLPPQPLKLYRLVFCDVAASRA